MFRRTRSATSRIANRISNFGRKSRFDVQLLEDRTVPATITVTNNLDTVAVDGTVSLREALNSINGAANINADVVAVGAYGSTDTVLFSGVTSPILLPAGQLAISKSTIIQGPGSGSLTVQNTIAAGTTARVFNITAGTVSMSGLTVTGGNATSNGGGIATAGTTTLTGMVVTGNKTTTDGGGIVVSGGSLTLVNSVVDGNFGTGTGSQGGGVRIGGAQTLTVTNSTISNNTAGEDGGGIYFFSGGALVMDRSTVSGNKSNTLTVSNGGGGIYLFSTVTTIRNSTISGNSTNSGGKVAPGGGISSFGTTVVANLIQNSTIAFNDAGTSLGGGFHRGGSASVTFDSSIFSNNTATTGPDVNGTIAVANQSLIQNAAGATITTNNGTQTGVDPLLGALTNALGGTTKYHVPGAGSPAIDKGNNNAALSTDQRGPGFPRVQNGVADVGSFESASVIPSASGGPYASVVTVSPDYTFTVTYQDNDSNINVATLDNNDITVSGPGFAATGATFISSTGAAKSVTATYKITPPDLSFDVADNGTYTISVNGGQVFDTDGTPNAVPAGTVGTFKVAIPTTFVVNATNDESIDSDTKTSLREALDKANADTSTADSITFDPTVFATFQTITLALGELKVSGAVTITGPSVGVVIDAATLSRVMSVDVPALSGQAVSISNMTLGNGATTLNGAGINNNDEALTLNKVTIQSNTTTGEGGGISVTAAAGSLNLTDCVIIGNKATGTASNGGGIDIRLASAVTLLRCTVSANESGEDGGGIYFFSGGSLTMTNSTVSGNKGNTAATGAGGGGIYLFSTTTNIVQSTISGNSTNSGGKDSNGGGIAALSASNVTILNSTVAFNNAGTLAGGGLHNGGSATITINSTIVSDNAATTGPDVNGKVNADFSLISNTAGATITGANNITGSAFLNPLALNGGTTQNHLPTASSPVFNKGANTLSLTTDQRGGPRTLDGVIDIGSVESKAPASSPPTAVATAPNISVAGGTVNTITVVYTDAESNINISTLDNNDLQVTGPGGPYGVVFKSSTPAGLSVTATYEVTAPGGTFDAADNGTYSINVVAGQVFDTDTPTPQSVAAGKIGSYNVAVAGNFVVNATNDEAVDSDGKTSLREALAASNGTIGLADTISFDATVFATVQTITLALGQLAVSDAVTITGPTVGVVVDAATLSRVMNVDATGSGNNVSVSNMSLINGSSGATNGGGILNNDEALSLTNCNVTGNVTTADGGGISVASATGSLTMVGCTVSNNKATSASSQGGGINLSSGSTVSVDRSTISGNESGEDGAGFYFFFNGSLSLTNSTISGNKADTGAAGVGGGGIYFYGTAGTFLISNSTISGNIANNGGINGYGGGVLLNVFTGTSVIRNSTIAFNDAGKSGGGIAQGGGSSTWDSTIIASNTVAGVNAATSDVFFVAAITVSGDNNLIGIQDAATKATFGGTTQTGSLATPLDPLLGVLALNGAPAGSPFTHALKSGSPAINKGNNVAPALAFDQRGTGFARVVGGTTDVGAFEVQTVTKVVTSSILLNAGQVGIQQTQRSRVTNVLVPFDSKVSFVGGDSNAAAAFTLNQIVSQSGMPVVLNPVTLAASVDNSGPGTVVTLTFTGGAVDNISLADGRYALHGLAAQFASGLDGNGDGTGGDDFMFDQAPQPTTPIPTPGEGPLDITKIFRLFGDVTGGSGDGFVALADLIEFRLANGGVSFMFDFDNNGGVGLSDFIQFRLRFGGSI